MPGPVWPGYTRDQKVLCLSPQSPQRFEMTVTKAASPWTGQQAEGWTDFLGGGGDSYRDPQSLLHLPCPWEWAWMLPTRQHLQSQATPTPPQAPRPTPCSLPREAGAISEPFHSREMSPRWPDAPAAPSSSHKHPATGQAGTRLAWRGGAAVTWREKGHLPQWNSPQRCAPPSLPGEGVERG